VAAAAVVSVAVAAAAVVVVVVMAAAAAAAGVQGRPAGAVGLEYPRGEAPHPAHRVAV
jgi:hypothetical protein